MQIPLKILHGQFYNTALMEILVPRQKPILSDIHVNFHKAAFEKFTTVGEPNIQPPDTLLFFGLRCIFLKGHHPIFYGLLCQMLHAISPFVKEVAFFYYIMIISHASPCFSLIGSIYLASFFPWPTLSSSIEPKMHCSLDQHFPIWRQIVWRLDPDGAKKSHVFVKLTSMYTKLFFN